MNLGLDLPLLYITNRSIEKIHRERNEVLNTYFSFDCNRLSQYLHFQHREASFVLNISACVRKRDNSNRSSAKFISGMNGWSLEKNVICIGFL